MIGLRERLTASAARVVRIPFPFDLASEALESSLRMRLNEQAQGGFDDRFLCGQAAEAHRFAHQGVVDIDGRPHGSRVRMVRFSRYIGNDGTFHQLSS
jgi:hypothetical protein